MNKTVKCKINKTELSLLTYYENPQLKARDEKMETLIFNRRMLLNQLFKPTAEVKSCITTQRKCWQIVEVVCCLRG